MDIENFIAEFKKTFVYDILSQTLSDEQLFERVVDGDAVLWFKEQTRQMWLMWEKAKAQAVPEGFVLMPKEIDSFDSPIANALEKGIVRDWPASEIYAAMIEAQEPAND